MKLPNLIVVSPDAGGVERARFFAQKVEAPLAIVDKRRTDMNVAEVMNVVGDVQGKTCLIIDDIIDTAGTLVKTVDALYAAGAPLFTHAPAMPCFRVRQSTGLPFAAGAIGGDKYDSAARSGQKLPKIRCFDRGPVRRSDREHSHGDQRKLAVQLEDSVSF